MIIYKISEGQYLGRACVPTRGIDIYNTEDHSTTRGWDSDAGITSILSEIKKHKEENYKNTECSVEYSESITQTQKI